mgnify:CR=1 FL=1
MKKNLIHPKIGLLPLYLDLYDKVTPYLRPEVEKFAETIKNEFTKINIEVLKSPVCKIKDEFKKAINYFEKENVDAIVTLHLAYSPSLESAPLLAQTKIPVIILDTTPFFEFISSNDPNAVMLNHGIHGVQDLCNLLLRLNKKFLIEVGHWQKSDVIKRVFQDIKAAQLAKFISNSRVGSIGDAFEGMGDFFVEYEKLKQLIGINVLITDAGELKKFLPIPNSKGIVEKTNYLLAKYEGQNVDKDSLFKSVIAGIALNNWIRENKFDCFTMNFTKFNKATGLPTMPFLEAELLLAEGFGYAGEGDVLTSALVGTLNKTFSQVTFTEMFCPDWKENIIFLSHMGEVNLDLFSQKALLLEKKLPFIDINSPIIGVGKLKKGEVILVNLAPQNNSFNLILCSGSIIDIDDNANFNESIRGWFKPKTPIDQFLSSFSLAGGTHHSALVYIDNISKSDILNILSNFGRIMNWTVFQL